MLDLKRLSSTNLPYKVFCSTGEWIVSRDGQKVQISDCQGKLLTSFTAPSDDQYEFVETAEHFIFLFGGRQMSAVRKSDGEIYLHTLDMIHVGKCVTPMHAFGSNVVFGTRSMNRTQLVCYDPWSAKRVCQTSSWNLDKITDFLCLGNTAYAVLNQTLIASANMETGEINYTRFEPATIGKSIQPYRDGIVYPLQGMLTILAPEPTRVSVPGVIVDYLHAVDGNRVICSSNDKNQLVCFDLIYKKIAWKLPSTSPIRQFLTVETTDGQVGLARLDKHVVFVDLSNGVPLRTESITAERVRVTGKNIVISKAASTLIMEGI
jgi:hypothetical protein